MKKAVIRSSLLLIEQLQLEARLSFSIGIGWLGILCCTTVHKRKSVDCDGWVGKRGTCHNKKPRDLYNPLSILREVKSSSWMVLKVRIICGEDKCEQNNGDDTFQKMQTQIFNVSPCLLVNIQRRFELLYCPHIQGHAFQQNSSKFFLDHLLPKTK